MNVWSSLALVALLGAVAPWAWADDSATEQTGCAAKRQALAQKIEEAKAEGNAEQRAGLQKALKEINANCTEVDLVKQQEQKVLDARREVAKRQSDLDKAMSKGDPEKIDKRKEKLAESRKELQEAQSELEKVRPDEDD